MTLLAWTAGSGGSHGSNAVRPDGWAAAKATQRAPWGTAITHTQTPSANSFLEPINSYNSIFSFIALQRKIPCYTAESWPEILQCLTEEFTLKWNAVILSSPHADEK